MSRKYGQKGYDESSRPERSRQPPAAPRPKREGPRGKGFGAEREDVFRCRDCGAQRRISATVVFDTTCTQCARPLHNCVNCRYFDSAVRFQCRQDPPADMISKTKANECEAFAPKVVREFASDVKRDSEGRAAFDALFDF